VTALPGGAVTFVFTDIEGSTRLVKALRERYAQVLAEHRRLVRAAVAAHGGHEVDTQGDAFFVAFGGAKQAVLCALEIQRALAAQDWPDGARVRVRIGVHTGQAVPEGGRYTGLGVHRAARICAVARGGQVLISQATQALVEDEEEELGFTLIDVGEHRLKDLDRPVRLFQLVAPGLDPVPPPAGPMAAGEFADGGVHGFPAALTSFIGRAGTVRDVAGLLDHSRLVTVTGPGGVGKTRLAGEIARRVAGEFADGAWLAELAAVQDPALVPAAVSAVLGVPQRGGVPVLESLAAVMARQQLLLVLDNCEHVLGATAELCAALLPAADDVRILATSREPLGVAGEARYRLPPLTLPAPDNEAEGGRSEAVALFADRARRADPHFTVTGPTAPLVARLVARLDGMPLAIELAAARVESLGVVQLLDRLDDRLALLAGGNRLAAPRQQSLAATVEWSYRLLAEPERQVFRRLSVFPGPFPLEAAEAVAGAAAAPAVLHLVDCSLLTPPRPGPDGRARYLMLETLRAYALARLAEAGEQQAAAAALASYALRVAEEAAEGLATSSGELAAVRWLDAEDATVHQGLAWTLDHDPAAALRIAVALASWWRLRGRSVAGYALLRAAAAHAARDDHIWVTAQRWLGQAAYIIGDLAAALDHFTAVRDAAAGPEPSLALVWGLTGRSVVLENLGRIPEAIQDARRAVALARQIGYAAGEALALKDLSLAAYHAGDLESALEAAHEGQRIDPAAIPGWVARWCSGFLTLVLINAGDVASAQRTCADGLAAARQVGDLQTQALCTVLMADLDRLAGRMAQAGAHLREAVAIASRIGNRLRLLDCLDSCGHLCAATGRWAEAVTMWAALAACQRQAAQPDLPQDARRRQEPLHRAGQALGPAQLRAAEDRGAAMTLQTAVELAAMLTVPGPRSPQAPPTLEQLSARERELVSLVAQGRTDVQIAGQLSISTRTVSAHLGRIRDKTGCRRRADLTRLALQAGLV
jgi:predicted ATPase/class 3 adenylate cyclase/DNA-binding CsgD family transcriptional regulator